MQDGDSQLCPSLQTSVVSHHMSHSGWRPNTNESHSPWRQLFLVTRYLLYLYSSLLKLCHITGRSLYIQAKNTTHDNCTQTSAFILMLIHVACVIRCDNVKQTVVLTLITAPGPGVGRSRGQSSSPSRCRSATASCVRAYKQVLCHITCHTQGDDQTPTSHTHRGDSCFLWHGICYTCIVHC